MRLTKDQVEEAKLNQRNVFSKREVVIKNIESIQHKFENARGNDWRENCQLHP